MSRKFWVSFLEKLGKLFLWMNFFFIDPFLIQFIGGIGCIWNFFEDLKLEHFFVESEQVPFFCLSFYFYFFSFTKFGDISFYFSVKVESCILI